ncbi:MAG TPA: DUF1508 domain-containing protein [Kofleriaceae bacterium]|nr:DUF1508 domain-containing protein [Kofleriaceae bacterium]
MSYIGSTLSRFSLLAALLPVFAAGCAATGEEATDVSDDASEVGLRGRFDLFAGDDGQTYFNLESGNGEVLLSSEGYTDRAGALNGLLAVLDNGGIASRYSIDAGPDGEYFINLKAGNGQVIASSAAYPIYSHAARGVDDCINAVATYLEHWDSLTGARFEVFEGADSRFYFRLFANNGAQVLRSQGYADEANALNGAFLVADYGVSPAAYKITQTTTGWYFNLVAPNNRVIATSEIYSSKYNAERARDAIIALLPVVELL